ncbi:sugar ABC transporter substrate-binding protein [Xenorhabdus mauleonii]|uniref:Sugar ABC transporter substrate-binding protein n=1 Tax=Xenorhabdus mauleonii TaxID=351675 RepID=A0A1I3V781_9GAMM|nr:sugar ABC transporter substrate-binding protein [Xenorhabdus mauleonii]PHM37575.1 sugar ABC transporter substrate-binding protein [Xenorhabdus mauleonii]SFJ91145.1 hypothetical protein SAMN05421680_11981 [Xenorhabdus mauleonii]
MKQLYHNEGASGANKYTFEVYLLDNGSYLAVNRHWNRKLNKIIKEEQFTVATREELRNQNYPRTRQVKIFLNSDFWKDDHD